MIVEFDSHKNEKQKLAAKYWLDDETMEIAYGGSKGSGKSYLGCSLIFGDALIYPETMYFIARKKLNDLRKFTIPSIHEVLKNLGIGAKYYNYQGQDNYFELYNGSKVFLLDAKHMPSDPLYARFGSMQMTRGWIEEAGEFELSAKNNLLASVGRWKNDVFNLKGKVLQTCNPMKNYLYNQFYLPNKKDELPIFRKFVQALPEDNKKLPQGYIDNLKLILSESEKQRLLFGNWEYDDDPAILIPYENILNTFTNDFVDSGTKYIVADIARFGGDKTVIGVWSGLRLFKIVTIDKSGLDEVKEELERLRTQYQIPLSNIIVDEDGVGGGVVDFMKCKGFVNGSRALKIGTVEQNYRNLKTQCYYGISDLINNNLIYFGIDGVAKEKLIEELQYVKQKNMDKDGKLEIMSKEDVKEQLGRSPDYSDMVMMRYWFEIKPSLSWEVA
jgi:hypothetical protein